MTPSFPSKPKPTTKVLVVGAGPTGLTLACLLRRQGVDAQVVDRLAEPGRLAKAMVIWSRSLEILEGLGVARAAARAGIDLEHATYLDGMRLLASVRTNRVPGTRWQPLILPQNMLEGLLRERLHELGGVVRWGVRVTAIRADCDGVHATIVGDDGPGEQCSAAYVVGCDGLHSVVREAAAIGWHASAPYEEVFQLGDVEADSSLDRTTVHHFLGRNCVSVAIPMPGDLWRVVGYLDGQDPQGAPDREMLQRLLDEARHRGTTVRDVRWSGTFRVVRRLADDFRRGRLLLAGDAAHVHSPAGGQGLNTGIQDADNLAWKLALVVRGIADEKLLDSYTAERRPIAARILAMTQLQDKHLFGARSLRARLTRNAALRLADRSGMLERALIPDLAQVKVRYKNSPLSVSSGATRDGVYAVGRQVPDVALIAADAMGAVALRNLPVDAALTLIAVCGESPRISLMSRRSPTSIPKRCGYVGP